MGTEQRSCGAEDQVSLARAGLGRFDRWCSGCGKVTAAMRQLEHVLRLPSPEESTAVDEKLREQLSGRSECWHRKARSVGSIPALGQASGMGSGTAQQRVH